MRSLEEEGWMPLVDTQNGHQPVVWSVFERKTWSELKSLRQPNGLPAEEVMLRTNKVLAEVIRRGKTPIHPLLRFGVEYVLIPRLPAGIFTLQDLTDTQKEARDYLLAYHLACEALI